MKPGDPIPLGDVSEEVAALIVTLHDAQQRLEVLTEGEIDTVADRDGRTFLLRRAQEHMRRSESDKQAAILNALPAHIALLDQGGAVISVNEAWRSFGASNAIQAPGHGIGLNYLQVCDDAKGDNSAEAHLAAAGLRSVLFEGLDRFSLEYPCHSAVEHRWFLMTATPLAESEAKGAVVMHLDITARRDAEEEERAVRRLLDNIVENIPTAVQLKSVHDGMRIQMWNKAAEAMYGLPSEAAIGRTVHDLWPHADAERMHASDLELAATGVTQDYPDRVAKTRTKGDIRVHMRKVALLDAGGAATHVLVVADDMTDKLADQARLRDSESRFRSLTKLSSDWFWEQDEEHRFRSFSGGNSIDGWGPDQDKAVGLHRWDLGGVIPLSSGWDEHKGLMDAHQPFRNFEYRRILDDGRPQYVAASGEPVFDPAGRFTGYRGVATDITERKHGEEALVRFSTAMDATADAIYLVDRSSMAFIHVNDAACRMQGKTREELLALGPDGVLAAPRAELERAYDAIIASGVDSAPLEMLRSRKDGSQVWVELRRHAQRSGERWTIVTLVRDITERKKAEDRIRRLNRVYAVISGINMLIVRVTEREELFRESCRIAVEHGGFRMSWIGIIDRSRMELIPVASAGTTADFRALVNQRFSILENAPRGNALAARAIRDKVAAISNDTQSDSAIVFKEEHAARGSRSMVILPLVIHGDVTGLLTLYAGEAGFFDDEEMKLLTELAGDIAFAVDHIEKAAKLARMTRVNAMLSGINGAIVRIHDRQNLFEEACRIAVETGGLLYAWMSAVDKKENQLRPIATSGDDDGLLDLVRSRLSLRDDAPDGYGLSSRSVREKRALVANDILTSDDVRQKQAYAARGVKSIAALPLLVAGRPIGGFVLHAAETGFFDEDEMRLLGEVAANIAFATHSIDRAGKLARVTRVNGMLSGINGAIVRIRNRQELFDEACRIAVEAGNLPLAWVGVVDASDARVQMVASAGRDDGFLQSIRDRLAMRGDTPETQSLSWRAVRERRAVVVNDVADDPILRSRKAFSERGIKAVAVFPLVVAGRVAGVFSLHSEQTGFFDDHEMRLLNEMAANIAFAVDHIGQQERLDRFAFYDELTGLANRTLFLERLAQYLRSAVAGGHKLALFFLDLERFRNINDSLGREAGDAILKQMAEWLIHDIGDASLLARLGGDIFAIVLPEVDQEGDLARLLDKRIRALHESQFRVESTDLRLTIRVGVALFPNDGTDAATLLANAEAALKNAKARGDRFLFYTRKMTDAVAGKLTLENQLRRALENEEFVLYYQPKVSLDSGKLTGAEALIRWNDPQTGLVPPGKFIPILEETGLIYDVGHWALRKAIEDYLRWRAAGLPAVRIAVNVSPLQLRNRGFITEVRQVIGIDPAAAAGLELEITESVIMEDVRNSIATLQEIRAMGVTIAIDDFGTGFSSLSHLARLPVDTLKIDRSFVTEMTAEAKGLSLVSTIISLAHALKLKVVAEGVETEEQSRLLRLLRCDEMQGFLFSRPVPVDDFVARFLTLGRVAAP